ncbi:MAG: hypothetical protein IKL55_04550 [Clostridia bacterium]|nr:hypothetical protein [Clostridia bacterium]
MKYYIIVAIIIAIGYLIYFFRDYITWFVNALKVTHLNQKGIKDIQKEGMNKRNLTNELIQKYIDKAKENLDNLGIEVNKEFILNQELERHLRYSRFSEKYVLELFHEILAYMKLDKEKVSLKINYISSKYRLKYAGIYSEKNEDTNERMVIINIQNDMTMDTIISILAHESTHYLLLSNKIQLKDRIANECLTDVTAIMLGFGKYMIEGYKISNKVIYDEEFHRSIKKDRVGYLSYKDIKYALKQLQKYKK